MQPAVLTNAYSKPENSLDLHSTLDLMKRNYEGKHGYYVQFHFAAEPASLDAVESHLKLSDQVMLQHYRRL